MNKSNYHKIFVILILVFAIMGSQSSHCQEVKSKAVRFRISNLPDTIPPTISLVTPKISGDIMYQINSKELVLIGEVKDKSGIRFVSVNADVRSINEAGIFTTNLELFPGENRIQLVASDNQGNTCEQVITIAYIPPVITLADRIRAESTYYGLIIGVDDYEDPHLPGLDNPIRDAEKVRSVLLDNYAFKEDDIVLLRNPGRADIISSLDELARKVTPDDNVLIFYAGHGNMNEIANVGYWLPSDAYLNNSTNWLRNSTLVDYLKEIRSKHTLLISDACFAGSILRSRSSNSSQDKAYDIMYKLPSRKAMTSGTLTEVPDRSAFTKYLVDRLQENDNTYLSASELFSSFWKAAINNSDALPQYSEIKNVGDQGGEFLFILKQ